MYLVTLSVYARLILFFCQVAYYSNIDGDSYSWRAALSRGSIKYFNIYIPIMSGITYFAGFIYVTYTVYHIV